MNDEYFMHLALNQAEIALEKGEFPVGCLLVYENAVVAEGARTGTTGSAVNEIDHAEMQTLRQLCEKNIHINGRETTLYCTMEPCLMCYGAIILRGIGRIVYAYEDVMGGGTGCPLANLPALYKNSNIDVKGGILREESLLLFQQFFSNADNRYWAGSPLSEYTLKQ